LNTLTILLSEIDESIATPEIEVILAGFDCVPFHAVLRRELVELRLNNSRILRVGKKIGVCASSEVFLSLCLDTFG
jgi:hypothetical protein